MQRERYTLSEGFETTAIDSGTIWTTENIPIEDRRRRSPSPSQYRYPTNYFSSHPTGRIDDNGDGIRSYEPTSGNFGLPRASYNPERQRTEVSFDLYFYTW